MDSLGFLCCECSRYWRTHKVLPQEWPVPTLFQTFVYIDSTYKSSSQPQCLPLGPETSFIHERVPHRQPCIVPWENGCISGSRCSHMGAPDWTYCQLMSSAGGGMRGRAGHPVAALMPAMQQWIWPPQGTHQPCGGGAVWLSPQGPSSSSSRCSIVRHFEWVSAN